MATSLNERAAFLTLLRRLDPTPQRHTRWGDARAAERGNYMGWLESQFRYATHPDFRCPGDDLPPPRYIPNRELAVGHAAKEVLRFMNYQQGVDFTRSLLWMHSKLKSREDLGIDMRLRLRRPDEGDLASPTHKNDAEVLEDVLSAIGVLRDKDMLATAQLVESYIGSGCRCAAFDNLLTNESAEMTVLRRKDTMAQLEKGEEGRLAGLFVPDEITGVAPVEVAYNQPGTLMVVRINTHAASQAIGGNSKTVHCTSLNGAVGEENFARYAEKGPQYMALFPATGRMVALQFTTGLHEDEGNRTVSLEELFNQEFPDNEQRSDYLASVLTDVLHDQQTRTYKATAPAFDAGRVADVAALEGLLEHPARRAVIPTRLPAGHMGGPA